MMLLWCKEEKMYVCQHCWTKHCGEGHARGAKNIGKNPLVLFYIATIIASFVLPFSLLGCYNYYVKYEWSSLESTDVVNITGDRLFRLEGFMNESTDRVIFPPEKLSNKNENNFIFSDSTGSVQARTDRYMEIEKGPHAIREGGNKAEKVYKGGDEVIIIGKLVEGKKNLTLQIIWMGTNEEDIPPLYPLAALSIGSVALYLLVCFFVMILCIYRGWEHDGSKVSRIEVPITDMDKPKPDDLDWYDLRSFWVKQGNKPIFTYKRGGQILKIIWILVVLGFAIIYLYVDPYRVNDFIYFSAYGLLVFPILVISTGVYFNRSILSPSDFAMSQKGVHMYYEEPVERFLTYDFLAWNDIKGFYKFRAGRSVEWKIIKTNGVKVDINFLGAENRDTVIGKWKKMTKKKLRKK